MSQYFAEHGEELFSVGVEVIPVVPRKKKPAIDGWQSMEITEEVVTGWASTRPGHGVGVRGNSVPGLDVDVDDRDVSQAMLSLLDELIGRGPIRWGYGHKFLLPVESDLTRKVKSTIYQDINGKKYAIELLATGQQWVAYGYHEQAGRDYRWEREDLSYAVMTGLPSLSAEALEQVFARFDEMARDKGWTVYRRQSGHADSIPENLDDLDLSGLKAPIGLSMGDLENHIMDHPCDLYEDWVQGGMALHHETRGSDEGLILFDKWSSMGAGYGGYDVCEAKWKSFDTIGPGGHTVTMRSFIRKQYLEAKQEDREALFDILVARIAATDNHSVLLGSLATEISQEKLLNSIDRNLLAERIKSRYRALTHSNISVKDIRSLIALKDPTGEIRMEQNRWADEWVYALDKERMVSKRTKDCLTEAAFNAKFNRMLSPDSNMEAAKYAKDILKIPIVDRVQYHPGEEDLFTLRHGGLTRTCVNSFQAASVPAPKPEEEWLPRDRRNVELVRRHLTELFSEEWEAETVIDWLTWIVQNPGRFARWSVILVGVQGDGKTFIAKMMQAVLGDPNVTFSNLRELDSEFTDWAADTQMVIFDEIKISGRNRHQIIGKMKEYIANDNLAINEKFVKRRPVKNMASYFMTSNHLDAIPLGEDDRRFWPIKTKWRTREEMLASGVRGDEYFAALFNAIKESPGAIRQWFLSREISPAFSAFSPPTRKTELAKTMIEQSEDELQMALDILIEEGTTPFITKDYVSSTTFHNILNSQDCTIKLDGNPTNRRLSRFFALNTRLVKIPGSRIRIDGKLHNFWVTEEFIHQTGGVGAVRDKIAANIRQAIHDTLESQLIDDELTREL